MWRWTFNDPLDVCLDTILESMYSKIPVYDGEIDRMIGVLQVKRLVLEARKKSFDQLDLRELLQPAYFVPENRRTDILFKEMQAGNEKLAVLVDEYGGSVRHGHAGGPNRGDCRRHPRGI